MRVVSGSATPFSPYEEPPESDYMELGRYILEHPAQHLIRQHMENARALGFDLRDIDILQRAIRAGEAEYKPPVRPEDIPPTFDTSHPAVVYYMQLGGLIKIGTSTNLPQRMSTINPERLLVVESGDRSREIKRHAQFSATRRHGEWFSPSDALTAHIDAARRAFEEETGTTIETWLAALSRQRKPPTSSALTAASSPSGPASTTSNPCTVSA